jgi:uncharacterized membrane protein YfcA
MAHLLLAAAAALAFALSMISAGGAALLLLPVVRWTVGLEAVAPVVTVATMNSGLSRIALLREHIRWDLVRWYLPGAMIGGVLGARLFAELVQNAESLEVLRWIVGLFLVSTLLQYRFGSRERSFPMTRGALTPLGLVVGTLSGLVGGLGPVLNPFFLNLGVQREELVATKAFNAFFMHLAKIGTYATFGALDLRMLGFGLAAGAGAVLGNWAGRGVLRRMGEKRFRTVVVWMCALSGALMLVRG